MSGEHVRYFFFTLTVAAALFVARIVVGPRAQSGAAGSTYVAGRVIVKFRDGTSTAARVKSLSLVSAAGAMSERPSYANFDLARIDPNDAAEVAAAADALRPRPDVEYEHASYRAHTEIVPDDQYCPLQ
jgi:hypothetical protein